MFVEKHQLSSTKNDDHDVYGDCITACIIGVPEFKDSFDDSFSKDSYARAVK